MMRSIAIFLGLILACMTVPAVANAQQTGKIYRVGFLTSGPAHHFKARVSALRKGLRDLGYVVGVNVFMVERYANGQRDRLPSLASDLINHRVEVVVVQGDKAARVATPKAATPRMRGMCSARLAIRCCRKPPPQWSRMTSRLPNAC